MIPIEGIMVAVDFSKEAILAAKFAVSMAQEYQTKLYLLHVYDPLPQYNYLTTDFHENRMKKLREELSQFFPQRVKDSIDVELVLEKGHPVHHSIVEKAKELGVDVIVVGTKGRTGLAHVLVGSVAEHVIRYAPCPVFVIRNPKEKYLYDWD